MNTKQKSELIEDLKWYVNRLWRVIWFLVGITLTCAIGFGMLYGLVFACVAIHGPNVCFMR